MNTLKKILFTTLLFSLLFGIFNIVYAQKLVVNGNFEFITRREILKSTELNLLYGDGRKVDLLRNGSQGQNVEALIHTANSTIDKNINNTLPNSIQTSSNENVNKANQIFLDYIDNCRYKRLNWDDEKPKYLSEASVYDAQTATNNVSLLENGQFILNNETYSLKKKQYIIFHDENGSIPYYAPDAYYFVNSNDSFIFYEYCIHNCELVTDSYFDDYYHDSTGKMYKFVDKKGEKVLISSEDIKDFPGYYVNMYNGYLDNKELVSNGEYIIRIGKNGDETESHHFKYYKAKFKDPVRNITIDNYYYAMDDLFNIGGFNMLEPQNKEAYYIGSSKFHNLKINHQGIFYSDVVESDAYSLFTGDYESLGDRHGIPDSVFNEGDEFQPNAVRLNIGGYANLNTTNSSYVILKSFMLPVTYDVNWDISQRQEFNKNKNIVDLKIYKDDVLYQTLKTDNLMNSILIDTKNCNKLTFKLEIKTKEVETHFNINESSNEVDAPIDIKKFQAKAKIYDPNSNEDYSKQKIGATAIVDDTENMHAVNIAAYLII